MIKRIVKKLTATQILGFVMVIILAGLVASLGFIVYHDRERVISSNEQITANNERLVTIYDELYRQTEEQGIEPTTPDPSSVKDSADRATDSGNGLPGATGATGQAGARGERGPQGLMGEAGQTGPVGPIGPKGDTGATGAVGASGVKGDAGPVGQAGPAGAPGPAGAAGPKGDVGAQGPQGIQGAPGQGITSVSCQGSNLIFYGAGDMQLGSVSAPQVCLAP